MAPGGVLLKMSPSAPAPKPTFWNAVAPKVATNSSVVPGP
jgi:hypothetical protein